MSQHLNVGVFAALEQLPSNDQTEGANNHIKRQILWNWNKTEVAASSVLFLKRQLDFKLSLAGGQPHVQMYPGWIFAWPCCPWGPLASDGSRRLLTARHHSLPRKMRLPDLDTNFTPFFFTKLPKLRQVWCFRSSHILSTGGMIQPLMCCCSCTLWSGKQTVCR